MNLKFFSLKTAATIGMPVSKFALAVSVFRQITTLIEVNGAEKLLINYLMRIHPDDIGEIQKRISHLLINEKPLTDQMVSEDQKLVLRAADRCREVVVILKNITGYDFNGKVAPKLTIEEKDARIKFLLTQLKVSKRDQDKISSELETTKITNVKLKRAVIQLRNNLEVLNQKLSMEVAAQKNQTALASPQDLIDLQTRLNQKQQELEKIEHEKSQLSQESDILKTKINRLESSIDALNNQIEMLKEENKNLEIKKTNLETDPISEKRNSSINQLDLKRESNQRRIQALETEKVTHQSQIESYQAVQTKLKNQIIDLELVVIKSYQDKLFTPFFLFLSEYQPLNSGLKYQLALNLTSRLKKQNLTQLWHDELFPLLSQLKINNSASLFNEWLKNHMAGDVFQHSIIENYFSQSGTFSYHYLTVQFLLTQIVMFETDSLKEQLISELLGRKIDEPAFWQICWEIIYSAESLEIKIKRFEELWIKNGIEHTRFYLSHTGLMLLYNEPPEIKLKQEILLSHLKNTLKTSELNPRFYGYGANLLINAVFSFGFLNEFLFFLNIIPNASLGLVTALMAVPYFLFSSYGFARLWKITSESPWHLAKIMMFKLKEKRAQKFVSEVLKETGISPEEFKTQLWQPLWTDYQNSAQLIKKLFLKWVPKHKQSAWPTVSLDNQELDRLVKLVALGKTNASEEKIFSHLDFNLVRSALILELTHKYLKSVLAKQTQNILAVSQIERTVLKSELKKMMRQIKKQDVYVFSEVFQKDFSRESLRILNLYIQYEK
jgi:hypothetical protein